MRNNTKLITYFPLLLLLCLPLLAAAMQDSVCYSPGPTFPAEVEHPAIRTLNEDVLKELRNDSAMDYHTSSPDDNFWDMFKSWLFYQLLKLFGNAEAAGTLETIFYVLALAALIYAVLRLLKVDVSGLFVRKSRRAVLQSEEGESHENIHELDLGTALAEAIKANEYNKAIRLLYLSALKELTEREHIRWQPGKTNYQYQQELQAAHLKAPFRQLGSFFEYAWYGNFQISEQHFREAEHSYQSLQQNLQPQA